MEAINLATVETRIAPARALFRCCEDWEHSQRDDSDWYCVAFDANAGKLTRVETGSTRYANGLSHGGGVLPMTPEIRPLAEAALIDLYFSILTRQEERAVMAPKIETLARGVKVRLVEDARCAAKKPGEPGVCQKCQGSGKWINPRQPSDKRECFACGGTGKGKRAKREKVTGADGKQVWEKIPAGATGEVLNQATFGTFYRGGYQQPDRSNTTVYLSLSNGREIQVKAEKLRLDREPAGPGEIRELAERAAKEKGYYPPFATARTGVV